ncbi:MAG: ADP-ribosylglycohydrolase family protein [Polyangiaceae bacterium]|nr:ADP-ribosylglycohydrolase family protein [Polyangiaceae bacterium]
MSNAISNYDEQVYAGVLGKVIGVYMGRPFEGWTKDRVIEHFGNVDRYVAEERGVPLVVTDDDITGTFTFIRALEDTGRYAETPDEDFGRMWLNYIIENKSILWWGGRGVSTEHTAFLRLKEGVKSPESGSCALNGKVVSEQIGAQIFIDAYGLVAPGNPELATRLARKSAAVSHDGEAIYGALVVAALVSAAFVEKDMDRLLDSALTYIPQDSVIAQVHRDVRAWARIDGDWHKTFVRIKEKYGYDKFGGCCHMVPNHAIMVMAWVYAPNSFRESQSIINTAGWDTDCNAANVGSVMGVKLGLSAINAEYDFQGPIADRILLPTAEPSRHVSDCLTEALNIARIGRKVMGWEAAPPPKQGATFHFSLPGARHGFQNEPTTHKTQPPGILSNVAWGQTRALAVDFSGLSPRRKARITTPLLAEPTISGSSSSYAMMGSPRAYPGQTIHLQGFIPELNGGAVSVRLFLKHWEKSTKRPSGELASEPVQLSSSGPVALQLAVPDLNGWPVSDLGIEIEGAEGVSGRLIVDRISFQGKPRFSLEYEVPKSEKGLPIGWIQNADEVRPRFSEEDPGFMNLVCSSGRGHLVTGTLDFSDYVFRARIKKNLVSRLGLVLRWQGIERYLAVTGDSKKLQLLSRYYGDHVLSEVPFPWGVGEAHELRVTLKGESIEVSVDGVLLLSGKDTQLGRGGFGFLTENGVMGFRETSVESL